jgi:hypothetical protein
MGKTLRVVVLGQTFAVKEDLKVLEFRWDGETQRWWKEIDSEELAELETAITELENVSIDTEGGEMVVGASLWMIEEARSGRSECRGCGDKIPTGELRLGLGDRFKDSDYTYKWYHLRCAVKAFPSHVARVMDQYGAPIPDREALLAGVEGTTAGEPKKKKAPGGKKKAKAVGEDS